MVVYTFQNSRVPTKQIHKSIQYGSPTSHPRPNYESHHLHRPMVTLPRSRTQKRRLGEGHARGVNARADLVSAAKSVAMNGRDVSSQFRPRRRFHRQNRLLMKKPSLKRSLEGPQRTLPTKALIKELIFASTTREDGTQGTEQKDRVRLLMDCSVSRWWWVCRSCHAREADAGSP